MMIPAHSEWCVKHNRINQTHGDTVVGYLSQVSRLPLISRRGKPVGGPAHRRRQIVRRAAEPEK